MLIVRPADRAGCLLTAKIMGDRGIGAVPHAVSAGPFGAGAVGLGAPTPADDSSCRRRGGRCSHGFAARSAGVASVSSDGNPKNRANRRRRCRAYHRWRARSLVRRLLVASIVVIPSASLDVDRTELPSAPLSATNKGRRGRGRVSYTGSLSTATCSGAGGIAFFPGESRPAISRRRPQASGRVASDHICSKWR